MTKVLHWFSSPLVAGLYLFLYGCWAGISAGAAVMLALLLVRGLMWPLVDLETERDCAALCLIGAVLGCAVGAMI